MNLDFYCERLTTDFWAEPLNAWSNLGFFAAGIWGLWTSKKLKWGYPQTLSVLALVVGIGSFLFHTFANKATHLGDLIPIFVFTLVFVYFSFRHVLGLKTPLASLCSFLFVALMVAIEIKVPKAFLNGSALYLPPLATLLGIGFFRKSQLYRAAGGVFGLSLVARTLDMLVCDSFPVGTHFVWHLFNGVCLGIMIKIVILHMHLRVKIES